MERLRDYRNRIKKGLNTLSRIEVQQVEQLINELSFAVIRSTWKIYLDKTQALIEEKKRQGGSKPWPGGPNQQMGSDGPFRHGLMFEGYKPRAPNPTAKNRCAGSSSVYSWSEVMGQWENLELLVAEEIRLRKKDWIKWGSHSLEDMTSSELDRFGYDSSQRRRREAEQGEPTWSAPSEEMEQASIPPAPTPRTLPQARDQLDQRFIEIKHQFRRLFEVMQGILPRGTERSAAAQMRAQRDRLAPFQQACAMVYAHAEGTYRHYISSPEITVDELMQLLRGWQKTCYSELRRSFGLSVEEAPVPNIWSNEQRPSNRPSEYSDNSVLNPTPGRSPERTREREYQRIVDRASDYIRGNRGLISDNFRLGNSQQIMGFPVVFDDTVPPNEIRVVNARGEIVGFMLNPSEPHATSHAEVEQVEGSLEGAMAHAPISQQDARLQVVNLHRLGREERYTIFSGRLCEIVSQAGEVAEFEPLDEPATRQLDSSLRGEGHVLGVILNRIFGEVPAPLRDWLRWPSTENVRDVLPPESSDLQE